MSEVEIPREPAGRVVVITAAGDGIGQATAHAFARAEYRLVLVDLREDAVAATARALPKVDVEVVVADVTDEGQVAGIADRSVERFGEVNALVNVVGGSRPGKTTVDLALDEWNRLLALNLTSTFLMCRAFIPQLERAGGGAIVNVSSGAGISGMSANPGYCAAKAGVVALTRALAIDHSSAGIRVNCVAPGPIGTPLMRRNRRPDEIAALGRLMLIGRIGEPEEVAAAILWLAGDDSSYVVGQTIEVNGGSRGAI